MMRIIKIFFALIAPVLVAGLATAEEGRETPRTLAAESIHQLMSEMVWVEGGTFTMGSNSDSASPAEQPAHEVTISGFYMGKFELSQKLFREVMRWDHSYFPAEGYPVNNVSWINIQRFIERLSAITGKTFRLPTEAEWEYAAKGGALSKGYQYSGSNDIAEVAWYVGNADRRLHPSGKKKPNELGLYDMTGNLWEFCRDDAVMRPYPKGPRTDPLVGSFEEYDAYRAKITRGGGYEFDADESLLFRRDGATPNVRMADIGFRLVMVNDNTAESGLNKQETASESHRSAE